MEYIFYPDVFWMRNFVMDALVLFLAGKFCPGRSSVWRILGAAVLGASMSVLLFLKLSSYLWYQLLTQVLVLPLMVLTAKTVHSLASWFKHCAAVWLVSFFLGGILQWFLDQTGLWSIFWIWVLGAAGVTALAMYWISSRTMPGQVYELLVLTGTRKFSVSGYLDTGNLLVDPMVQKPVHIIQQQLLEPELEGQLPVRYIPFHSLGKEDGLLPVVTLKGLYVRPRDGEHRNQTYYVDHPVFGLAREQLFQNQDYQVILNGKEKNIIV